MDSNTKKAQEIFGADIVSPYELLSFSEVLRSGMDDLMATTAKDVVSFGYNWLDDQLTGLFPGELVVVGSESGGGKTTFATNIVYRASQSRRCVVFALEDRLQDYGLKALYFEIGKIRKKSFGNDTKNYPWNVFRKGELNQNPQFMAHLDLAYKNLKNENIQFVKARDQMNVDVLEKALNDFARDGVELVLIDHLHYFDLNADSGSKADYIEKVMVKLKTVLNNTGLRALLIVHYKKLGGAKPNLDSFKDSISIVQNANYVINIWRERGENTTEENKYQTIFSIPKSRNPNGEATITVEFDPNTNDYKSFESWRSGGMKVYETLAETEVNLKFKK